MSRQQPTPVNLRSYAPLCPGRASAVEALDPGEVNRLVQEQAPSKTPKA